MVEAVRTTASTFGIWAIVAVAMICLAAWLISVYIADGQQTRLSRTRRRMDAPRPVLGESEGPAAAASIPGQRRDAGQPGLAPEPRSAPWSCGRAGRFPLLIASAFARARASRASRARSLSGTPHRSVRHLEPHPG